jgi:hypothetical protein
MWLSGESFFRSIPAKRSGQREQRGVVSRGHSVSSTDDTLCIRANVGGRFS